MKLKIILFFTTLWSFGDYMIGVQCFDERELAEFNMARHQDLMDFVHYNANDFDTFNQECMLAGLVRLAMGPPFQFKSDKRLYMIMVIRLLSPENKNYLGVELSALLSAITRSIQSKGEITKTALAVINKGLEYNLWYTEKEMELINEFRYGDNNEAYKMSDKGFAICQSAFASITSANFKSWLDGKHELTNKLPDFSQISLLFSTPLEILDYDLTPQKTVFKVIQNTLVDVLRGMNHVLYNTKFTEAVEQELNFFPNGSSIHTEVLVILQHMYTEVVETVKEAYIVQVLNDYPENDLQNEYNIFATMFQAKWAFMFPEYAATFLKSPTDGPITEIPNIRPFLMISRHHNKDCTEPQCPWCNPLFSGCDIKIRISSELDRLIEKREENSQLERTKTIRLTSQSTVLQKKQDLRETSKKEESYDFLEHYHNGKTNKIVANGRLIKNQTISLPISQYFKKFNESWMDEGPNINDENQVKMFLLQLSVWQKIVHSNIQHMLQTTRSVLNGGGGLYFYFKKVSPKFVWDHWLFSGIFDILNYVAEKTGIVSNAENTTTEKFDKEVLRSFAIDKNFMNMFIEFDDNKDREKKTPQ